MADAYTVFFHRDFDESDITEMEERGYLLNLVVELRDGARYLLEFATALVLQQELDYVTSLGCPCISYAGVIIVKELTIQSIHTAIPELMRRTFFEELRQLLPDEHPEISQIIGL